jgi:hypothetical protein
MVEIFREKVIGIIVYEIFSQKHNYTTMKSEMILAGDFIDTPIEDVVLINPEYEDEIIKSKTVIPCEDSFKVYAINKDSDMIMLGYDFGMPRPDSYWKGIYNNLEQN